MILSRRRAHGPCSYPVGMAETQHCSGCGVSLPVEEGPVHAYIGASPACWRHYGELLAREYQDPAWFGVHQITVDAYAAQHPGRPERRAIQSVAVHLMTLGAAIERGLDPANAPGLHKRMVRRLRYRWLEPPSMEGRLSVLHPLAARDPDAHRRLVWEWGRDVWDAWANHHETIWSWLEVSLGSEAAR